MELNIIAENLRNTPGFSTVDDSSLAFAAGVGGLVSGWQKNRRRALLLECLAEAWLGLAAIMDLRRLDLVELEKRAETLAASYAERGELTEGGLLESTAALEARSAALARVGQAFTKAHVELMVDMLVFYGWSTGFTLDQVWATCVEAVLED